MKVFLLLMAFSILILSYEIDLTDSAFNKDIGIRLIENIDNTERILTLKCGTTENFICSNFSIATSHTVINNKITLNFTGIIKPGICKRSIGPATATISLGELDILNYELEINIGSSKIIGQMAVSDNSYKVTIPVQSKVKFLNPDLYRVPNNTIYGTVHYHSETTSPIAQIFFDSLKYHGATTKLFMPGDYGDFQIEDNGQIKQTKNSAYYFTQHYIFNYTNATESLENIVKQFGLKYPNLLHITLFTSQGKTFSSWVP